MRPLCGRSLRRALQVNPGVLRTLALRPIDMEVQQCAGEAPHGQHGPFRNHSALVSPECVPNSALMRPGFGGSPSPQPRIRSAGLVSGSPSDEAKGKVNRMRGVLLNQKAQNNGLKRTSSCFSLPARRLIRCSAGSPA